MREYDFPYKRLLLRRHNKKVRLKVVNPVAIVYRRVYNKHPLTAFFSCCRDVGVNRFGDLYDGGRAIFAAFV